MQVYFSILLAIFIGGFSCGESEDSSGIEYAVRKIQFHEDLLKSIAKSVKNGSSQVLIARPENVGSGKDKPKGASALNDFGIIDLKKFVSSDDEEFAHYVGVNELNSDCKNLEECREKLLKELKGESDNYDFYVLPDGKILEGKGWIFGGNRGMMSIGILKVPSSPLTQEAMEAFAFLIQTQITAKRLSADAHHNFNFTLPDGAMRLRRIYSNMFDSDLSLSKVKVFGDVEYLAREDWGAVKPIRRLNRTMTKADLVRVRPVNAISSTPEKCLKAVRRLQREQMIRYSDLFSNFIICGDGRIYEGLGWDLSRKEKTVYIDILGETEASVSWTHVLAALTLTIREGIRRGNISENHTIEVFPNITGTFSKKIIAMGLLAKSLKEENNVVTIQDGGAGENISTSDHAGKEMYALEHPISTVRFIQKDAVCDEPRNCIPLMKRLGGEAIASSGKPTSNFYFIDTNVVFEGLGWGSSHRQGEVTFEFPTMGHQALPSNQSMYASMLLIREGVINGYLRPDYKTKVGKDTSVEFKNMIRFWDERIRG